MISVLRENLVFSRDWAMAAEQRALYHAAVCKATPSKYLFYSSYVLSRPRFNVETKAELDSALAKLANSSLGANGMLLSTLALPFARVSADTSILYSAVYGTDGIQVYQVDRS